MNIAKKSKLSNINIFLVLGIFALLGASQLQAQVKRDHRTGKKEVKVSIQDLKEDEKHQDISFLSVDNDCDDDVAMNNKELVDAIAKDAGLSKADAGNVLNAFVCNITKSLKKGNSVQLIGFGTFSTSYLAARTGRDPQTGAAIKIKARKVVRFKSGIDLKAPK